MRTKKLYLAHESRTLCETCRQLSRIVAEIPSFRMFETNMDEYLDEETEWVKLVLDGICKAWDKQVRRYPSHRSNPAARRCISSFSRSRSRRPYFSKCLKPRPSQAQCSRRIS